MSESASFPISDSLTVLDGETIYRTDEWHKAAVLYTHEDKNSDFSDPELAIYLWHKRDGKWGRKQKYSIRTADGWKEDREVLEQLLNAFDGEIISGEFTDPNAELPVSDYYNVSTGITVFKTNRWWKAGVVIDAKGEYETTEVILYVWQRSDDEWKVRQKYAVKRPGDWKDDLEALSPLLDELESGADVTSDEVANNDTPAADRQIDRERLQKAMERRHLTRELADAN
ncbi:hypothetical protein [Natronosalvus rutilus]|uniref:Uncharacterized protein n=1 Tax=Natronosalvus rutilus TaxID=2953753 RepID=A0A9E7SY00_9EURY|nr:hypothetical protein [Natronosalvus rutilus]UTF55586.1 hypothetical protein NGM29_19470 [Natronosalvus rutilus]